MTKKSINIHRRCKRMTSQEYKSTVGCGEPLSDIEYRLKQHLKYFVPYF